MWSGPRNLSTAMMYAFAARSDCAVIDEPFYASFLVRTGSDHPLRDQIVAAHDTDPARVRESLAGPVPEGRALFYQKHMVHHMLDGFMPIWPNDTRHVFLIRHPARVVASYVAKRESPEMADLGFEDQLALFHSFASSGTTPLVIDSETVRSNPGRALAELCRAAGIHFDRSMLAWPKGGHAADGLWAAHWYGAVHRSTGFAGPEGPLPLLEGHNARLAEGGLEPYLILKSNELVGD